MRGREGDCSLLLQWLHCLRRWLPLSVCRDDRLLQLSRQELLADLITKGELFWGPNKTKTLLSLCPGGNSCFSTKTAFALLTLPGSPSPKGNPTYPTPTPSSSLTRMGASAFARSFPFRLKDENGPLTA